MTKQPGYLRFMRANLPFLATGMVLSFLSSFGQTFFISIFGAEVRAAYGLSNGDWGVIYMVGTGASAVLMVFAGGLADKFRVRTLGIAVILLLACACLFMALNTAAAFLPVVIFGLRFTGQGMTSHVATVAMARWFIATRGRALAIAAFGFMFGEATLPLTMVWLKSFIDWRTLWICFAGFCLLSCFILHRLLRLERTPQSMAKTSQSTGMGGKHWTRRDALRHPLFWAMIPAVMSFSGFATAFWFHQAHFAEIKGWSHLALVSVFPLGTTALALSTIGYGWAIDRFGAIQLLRIYLLPLIVAFVLHWYAPSLVWTGLAVILMGIAGGGQATLLNACWAEFYGTQHLGAIKSAAAALMVLGSAIGPGLSGWLIDIGVGFEVQQLGYAAMFAFAALILIKPTKNAARILAVTT